jgi:glycosyltransferase involved in cell wall biosynthesis
MSIVFINYPLETFTPTQSGAIATIIWECCRAARAQGIHPTVITRTSHAEIFPWLRTIEIDYPFVPVNRLVGRALRAQRRLAGWRHLRHRAYAARVARAIRKADLAGSPLILINDPETAIYLRHRFPSAFILHWFENQLEASTRVRTQFGRSVDVVAGVSEFTSRWVAAYYKLSNVRTIYNGVDTDHFHPAPNGGSEEPVISFVGRTGIEKAPDLLLRAAIKLLSATKSFSIQMIGSNHWDRFEMDAYQRELQQLSDELSRAGIRVRRPGHVGRSALPEYFRQAHIHVVPSRWDEPFGLTTVEGMASGLATAASNTGGTQEVVGDAGLLFERDSVDELAGCLSALVKSSSLRTEYAAKARARAKEFTWQRTWTALRGAVDACYA